MPKKTAKTVNSIHDYLNSKDILHAFAIFLITVITYLQTLTFHFVWDDVNFNIVENPYINKKETTQLAPFWQSAYAKLYIPLTYTAWYLQAKLSRLISPNYISEEKLNTTDLDPAIFHFFNLAFHTFNALLFYFLIRKLLPKLNKILALIAVLFFSLHPIQIEVVAWVTGFKDLLATFFILISSTLWIYYRTSGENQFKHLAIILFVCSILSKPSSIILPFIFMAIDILHYKISFRDSLRANERLILISIASLIFTKFLQPDEEAYFTTPLWLRPFVALDSLFFYIRKIIWPFPLCIDYGRTPQFLMQQSWLGLTASIPIIITLLVLKLKNLSIRNNLLLLYLVFILALSPTLGLIPYEYQSRYSSVADRYAYIALFPASIAISIALGFLLRRIPPIIQYIIAACIIIPIALSTYNCSKRWENNLSLYQVDVQINPRSQHLQVNYAVAYSYAFPNNVNQIIPNSLASIQIQHDFYEGLNTLGVLYDQVNQTSLALRYLKRAAFVRPDLDKPQRNIALTLYSAKQFQESIPYFETYLKMRPNDVEMLSKLADVYYHLQKWNEALKYYERCVQLIPNFAQAYIGAGASAINLQLYAKALTASQEAVRLLPHSYDAQINCGSAYIGLKNFQDAIPYLEQAAKIQPHSPEPHRLLAAAYEALGKPPNKQHHLQIYESLIKGSLHSLPQSSASDRGSASEDKTRK